MNEKLAWAWGLIPFRRLFACSFTRRGWMYLCVFRFLFFVGISYNRITFLTAAMAASKTSASNDTTDTTKPLTLNRRKEISLLSLSACEWGSERVCVWVCVCVYVSDRLCVTFALGCQGVYVTFCYFYTFFIRALCRACDWRGQAWVLEAGHGMGGDRGGWSGEAAYEVAGL